ncbi:MAG: HD domain-containing protein [Erysipelotrichaceae bacterium]|nr:HD domain-containing protein [Erysipelotrichaceae bacterium]
MYVNRIYNSDVPDFIKEISELDIMQRLKDTGMDCGCEYTSFSLWQNLLPGKRYEHSIGVGLIVWHFTGDEKQAIAGLLHDISTPAFAHVIDFMNHDYLSQESTESDTRNIIENSTELQLILERHGLSTDDVCDYHKYPIADNDSPRLSADRLEYTMRNFYRYLHLSEQEIRSYYDDLCVISNEEGIDELAFNEVDKAEEFVINTLKTSSIYIQDADRYSMELLGRIVKDALERKVIEYRDIYAGESVVIEKLKKDDVSNRKWNDFCAMNEMMISDEQIDDSWIKVAAKKRYIDPLVKGKGRISVVSPKAGKLIEEFKNKSFDYYMKGKTRD